MRHARACQRRLRPRRRSLRPVAPSSPWATACSLHAPGRQPCRRPRSSALRGGLAQASPFGTTDGLGAGAPPAHHRGHRRHRPRRQACLARTDAWLGRVHRSARPAARRPRPAAPGPRRARCAPTRRPPPPAPAWARAIDLGVRALNCFTTCRTGQRLGLFAGSGVGKSTLLAMLARHTACDVAVLALVGERGREVREFLEDDLGRRRPGPRRRRRRHLRRAAAAAPRGRLRRHDRRRAFPRPGQIGAAADGQRHPLLPGPARDRPGRRRTARHPRLPAQRVRRAAAPAGTRRPRPGAPGRAPPARSPRCSPSWSRATTTTSRSPTRCAASSTATSCSTAASPRPAATPPSTCCAPCPAPCRAASRPTQTTLLRRARAHPRVHADMADMVRLGAYRAGSDPAVDAAFRVAPRIEAMLTQGRDEPTDIDTSFALLAEALGND